MLKNARREPSLILKSKNLETKKQKENRLNEAFSDMYSEEQAVDAFIYLANKKRWGGRTRESHIRHCHNNHTLGSLLRRLDPTAFQLS